MRDFFEFIFEFMVSLPTTSLCVIVVCCFFGIVCSVIVLNGEFSFRSNWVILPSFVFSALVMFPLLAIEAQHERECHKINGNWVKIGQGYYCLNDRKE
jgi:hypothetical protein